jgi:hypothetical protein
VVFLYRKDLPDEDCRGRGSEAFRDLVLPVPHNYHEVIWMFFPPSEPDIVEESQLRMFFTYENAGTVFGDSLTEREKIREDSVGTLDIHLEFSTSGRKRPAQGLEMKNSSNSTWNTRR